MNQAPSGVMRWDWRIPSDMSTLDAALVYLHGGAKPVFVHGVVNGKCTCKKPDCRSIGKHPILPGWQKNIAKDEIALRDQASRLRVQSPNIGVVLGEQPNGEYLVAIDVDDAERFAALTKEFGDLPPTPRCDSGRGYRLFYRLPAAIPTQRMKNVTGAGGAPGVDAKAEAGQVVVGPSRHFLGGQYAWSVGGEILELPMSWVSLLVEEPKPPPFVREYTPETMRADSRAKKKAEKYLERAVIEECSLLARMPEGQRNTYLYKKTISLLALVNGCFLPARWGYVLGELHHAAKASGLGETEIRKTLTSAELFVTREGATRGPRPVTEFTGAEDASASTSVAISFAPPTRFTRADHVELGETLVADLNVLGKTVGTEGNVYRYEPGSGLFGIVDDAVLSCTVQGYAGQRASLDGKQWTLRLKASDVKGAMTLAKHRVDDRNFFVNAPPGIPFSDCFVEVSTKGMERHPHSSENRARLGYPFPYTEDEPTEFLKFLDALFRDDEDKADKTALVGEFFGGALLGVSTRLQQCIVSIAEGGAGRSSLIEIIEAGMPVGSTCAIAPQKMSGDGNSPDYFRAKLVGMLINIVSELPESDIFDSTGFKAIVSGDLITGRHPAGRPFDFRPRAGHFFAANKLPHVNDQTEGFWRRILVLKFGRTFHLDPELERGVAERIIRKELPSVVGYLLRAGQRLLRQGSYTVPKSHAEELASWRRATDAVRCFVEERCERLPSGTLVAMGAASFEIYSAFMNWCAEHGHKGMAANTFGTRMASMNCASKSDGISRRYPVRLKGQITN